MKKKLLFLLIPLLIAGTVGCVKYNGKGKNRGKTSAPTSQESSIAPDSSNGGGNSSAGDNSSSQKPIPTPTSDELPVGTDVKVYLVFGEYGLYKDEAVNNKIESLFLEHAIELEAKVGDRLPTRDDVKSTVEGSKFVAWTAYNDDGKLTQYTKVPSVDKKILYASFSGGKGGNTGYDPIPPAPGPTEYAESSTGALPTSGFGFKFSDDSYMAASHTEDYDGFQQYLISQRAFKKDQVFTLYDFGANAGWVVSVDPYSFGGTSAHSENWKEYITNDGSKYTVVKDFNVESVYIKIKNEADQVYFQLAA